MLLKIIFDFQRGNYSFIKWQPYGDRLNDVNFDYRQNDDEFPCQISLVSLLLTLNLLHTLLQCFYCQLWAGEWRVAYHGGRELQKKHTFKVSNKNWIQTQQ